MLKENGLAPPSDFRAIANESGVLLEWKGVKNAILVKGISRYPETPSDGEIIYEGSENSFFDEDAVFGADMYYTAFAIENGKVSKGARAKALIETKASKAPKKVSGESGIDYLPAVIIAIAAIAIAAYILHKRGKKKKLRIFGKK